MNLANTPIKQEWVIAIVLLISRKPACHTLKTYAYPVIQQGRKRVGIASNLPASLFFLVIQAWDSPIHKARQKYNFSPATICPFSQLERFSLQLK